MQKTNAEILNCIGLPPLSPSAFDTWVSAYEAVRREAHDCGSDADRISPADIQCEDLGHTLERLGHHIPNNKRHLYFRDPPCFVVTSKDAGEYLLTAVPWLIERATSYGAAMYARDREHKDKIGASVSRRIEDRKRSLGKDIESMRRKRFIRRYKSSLWECENLHEMMAHGEKILKGCGQQLRPFEYIGVLEHNGRDAQRLHMAKSFVAEHEQAYKQAVQEERAARIAAKKSLSRATRPPRPHRRGGVV